MINRLSRREDFQTLRREGHAVQYGPLQVIHHVQDEPPSGVRVAFAIGRSVGTAVTRNRTRRRLRSVMNDLATENDGLPAGDYLIRVNPSGANANSRDLRVYIETAMNLLRDKEEKRV